MWLDSHFWGQHFLFYNLSENIYTYIVVPGNPLEERKERILRTIITNTIIEMSLLQTEDFNDLVDKFLVITIILEMTILKKKWHKLF